MDPRKKIIIVAPFWGNKKNVGCIRIEKYIRWFQSRDIEVIIIKAGRQDSEDRQQWGYEITIKDPTIKWGFNFTGDTLKTNSFRLIKSIIRKFIIICNAPDAQTLWTKKIASHPLISKYSSGISYVLSSSPPESVHLASSQIADKTNAKLIIDLRDGWLDDSLSKVVGKIPFRKIRESKIEKKILQKAGIIFVTSENWKKLLTDRLEFTRNKTFVLTNGYALNQHENARPTGEKDEILLVHAGKFTGSDKNRRITILLDILFKCQKDFPLKVRLILVGDLEKHELKIVSGYREKFKNVDWKIETISSLPRSEMLNLLVKADGLLLLNTSNARIPIKLFDYIPLRKPILGLTPGDGAVWRIGKYLPQLYLADFNNSPENSKRVLKYFQACKSGQYESAVPEEFSDAYLAKTFFRTLGV
jgi:hypothetical protein